MKRIVLAIATTLALLTPNSAIAVPTPEEQAAIEQAGEYATRAFDVLFEEKTLGTDHWEDAIDLLNYAIDLLRSVENVNDDGDGVSNSQCYAQLYEAYLTATQAALDIRRTYAAEGRDPNVGERTATQYWVGATAEIDGDCDY